MFRPPRRRQALQSNHGNHDRRASPFPPCPPSPPERVADRVGRRCRPLGLDPDRAPLTVATLWSSWQLASTGFRSPASTRFIVAIVYRLAAFVSRWCCETPKPRSSPTTQTEHSSQELPQPQCGPPQEDGKIQERLRQVPF